ncbi:MAG: HAD family phosphatase [Archangium sp.]
MAGIAYFDLDKTILSVNSGTLWVRREVALGHLSKRKALKAAAWLARYHFGFASADSIVKEAVAFVTGTKVSELRSRTEQFFVEEIRGMYRPGALEAIERHRAEGRSLVMLTSSTNYMAELVTAELKLDGMLCNVLEADGQGVHTGNVAGGICFGAGKLTYARRDAEARGVPLSDSIFYTDSFADLSVLEVVGTPVAVNPDLRLRRAATKRGWSIVDWGVPVAKAA